MNAASLSVIGYHFAKAIKSTTKVLPAKKRSVRFTDEHAVQDCVEPVSEEAVTPENPRFDNSCAKFGMHPQCHSLLASHVVTLCACSVHTSSLTCVTRPGVCSTSWAAGADTASPLGGRDRKDGGQ